MTLLGPVLMGGIFVTTFLLNKVDTEKKTIVVLDESHFFHDKFKGNDHISFIYMDGPLDTVRSASVRNGYFGVLFIPATSNLGLLEKSVTLYSGSTPGLEVLSRITSTIEKEINGFKYAEAGIDEKKLDAIKTDVEIRTRDLNDKETSSPLTSGLGFAGGLLIYLFIFIYGAMVMRGVMEEKTNRIVEVIISSVRPFQLMMGKIIGVALVGLTQFLLWVILSFVVINIASAAMLNGKSDKEKIESVMQLKPDAGGMQTSPEDASAGAQGTREKITMMLSSINFPLLIGMFIFYFLAGFLLYSALFAAIGAAVDSETDTQQFMLPVTIPLIIAYVAAMNVINNPQGNVAFWFSIIPFTSPIVMMVRIPFGVPWLDVVLSILMLIAGFIFTTWLAGKIYRTGILMYGKKVSYRELWKWLKYH